MSASALLEDQQVVGVAARPRPFGLGEGTQAVDDGLDLRRPRGVVEVQRVGEASSFDVAGQLGGRELELPDPFRVCGQDQALPPKPPPRNSHTTLILCSGRPSTSAASFFVPKTIWVES